MSATQVSVSTDDKEAQWDRRVNWAERIGWILIASAVWCARLEFKANDTRADVDELSHKWAKDHDGLTGALKDIEWLKRERGHD